MFITKARHDRELAEKDAQIATLKEALKSINTMRGVIVEVGREVRETLTAIRTAPRPALDEVTDPQTTTDNDIKEMLRRRGQVAV